jgi:hypothetical protein
MPLTIAEEYPNVWVVHNAWGDRCHAAQSLESAAGYIVGYIDNQNRLGIQLRWA